MKVKPLPTSAQLDAQRRAFALASPQAAYHFIALAREQRGQPWNGANRAPGVLGHAATVDEREDGIGFIETVARREFIAARRMVGSGRAFPG
jgi:hypothetical protein